MAKQVLHNKINSEELRQQMLAKATPRTTISFYKYFKISDPQTFRDSLFVALNELEVFGRIYVAAEGINAQVSVPTENFDAFKSYIYSVKPFNEMRLNIAVEDDGKSFWLLKIKVRAKIVADGISDETFDPAYKGKHLKAAEFNEMAADANTIIVDMRNHYEYEVGHFEKAIEVPSDTFRDQLPMAVEMMKNNAEKNIVMYCTGGIRCEKASAYMLHNGFKNIFQLDGGIIEYTRKAKEENLPNLFKGKNFVFDDRLGERISEDIISTCHQCEAPSDRHTNCANSGCHILFIQCESCATKYNGCCSETCQEEMALPEEVRKARLKERLEQTTKTFNKAKNNPLRPRKE